MRPLAVVCLLALVCTPVSLAGQQSSPPPVPPTAQPAPAPVVPADSELGVSVERIKRALTRPPGLEVEAPKPLFRIEVIGDRYLSQKFSLEAIFKPEDLKTGPAGLFSPTHQEFLDMTTPKVAQPYGAFNGGELAVVGLTTLFNQLFGQAAFRTIGKMVDSNAEERAKREVQEALEAFEKARQAAKPPQH